MKPEPSIRKTRCGAADTTGAVVGRSATTAWATSSMRGSSRISYLARRRAFARTLLARPVRRRRDSAGPKNGAVDEEARAIGALHPAFRREAQIDLGVAERLVAAIAGRDHLVDLDRLERSHHSRFHTATITFSAVASPHKPLARACPGHPRLLLSAPFPNG